MILHAACIQSAVYVCSCKVVFVFVVTNYHNGSVWTIWAKWLAKWWSATALKKELESYGLKGGLHFILFFSALNDSILYIYAMSTIDFTSIWSQETSKWYGMKWEKKFQLPNHNRWRTILHTKTCKNVPHSSSLHAKLLWCRKSPCICLHGFLVIHFHSRCSSKHCSSKEKLLSLAAS